jgi:MFS family permease
VAPSIEVFLAGRAFQGLANAFTTPLLLAGLAEMVPRHKRSGAIGVFASFQAAGQSLAAILAGTAASVNWRLAFAAVAVVAVIAALGPPPGQPRRGTAAPTLRSLVNLPILMLCAAGFIMFAGTAGIAFMVALDTQQRVGLSVTESGLLLTGFGLPGLILGRPFGGLVGRVGAARCGVVATVGAGAATLFLGHLESVAAIAVLWACAGAFASLFNISLQNLTLDAAPKNLAGGTSLVSALRFAGSAIAPAVWLPIFAMAPALAFTAAGAVTACASVAILAGGRVRRRVQEPPTAAANAT